MDARKHWFAEELSLGASMADVTVAQFAEVLKVPVDRLLLQLDSGDQGRHAEDMSARMRSMNC